MSRLVILGERPGDNEMRERAPMVGATGMHVLRALGVSAPMNRNPVGQMREWQARILGMLSARITNARCYLDEKESENEARAGYFACREHLQAEMNQLTEARTILCVGADATFAVLGRTDITNLHGSVWTRVEADAMRNAQVVSGLATRGACLGELPPRVHTVVCSFHPAYAMHGFPQAWPLIYRAITRARMWSLREAGPLRNFKKNLTPSVEDFERIIPGTDDPVQKLWLIDIETPMDNPNWIKMIGIAYAPDEVMVIPPTGRYLELFRRAMAMRGITKAGHNWNFDHRAFLVNGIPIADPIINTIEVESILRPPFKESSERAWLNLATTCQYHLDDWPFHKELNDPDLGKFTRAFYRAAFPGVPDGLMEQLYCSCDCVGNRRALSMQIPALKQMGAYELYTQVVMPNAPTLVRMGVSGVLYDQALAATERVKTKERIADLSARVQQTTADFHRKRREGVERTISELQSHRDSLIDGAIRGAAVVGNQPHCEKHPDYWGRTRRGKCDGCAEVYRSAAALRAALKDITQQTAKARGLLNRLGDSFLVTSADHWRMYLFDPEIGLGLEPVAFTETKNLPKVDDESIEELKTLHSEVDVLAYRMELSHLVRRLGIVLTLPTDEAGYAHFAFSLHRTSTGRSASGNDDDEVDKYRKSDAGNAQNWRDEDRRLIIASPGRIRASADFEQIELRTMGWKAKDLQLLDELRRGVDVHAENASAIYEIPASETRKTKVWLEGNWHPARQGGKKVTHMVDYGAREEKVGRTIRPWQGKPLEEVVEYLRAGERRQWVFDALRKRAARLRFDRVLPVIAKLASDPKEHSRLVAVANTVTARGWIDRYFAKRPRMREYQEELIHRAAVDGYITNSWGRRMTIYGWRWNNGVRTPAEPNEVIAFPGQSDAGEIAKACLRAMEDVFAQTDGVLQLFVHDSFDGEIGFGLEQDFINRAKPVMERSWPQMGSIPGFGEFSCPAAFAFGDNWGKYDEHDNPKGLREWKLDAPTTTESRPLPN